MKSLSGQFGNGTYPYPHDSKLRPASADESEFIEYADVPPFCILIPGLPPIFTFEPPINSSSDKSEPAQC